MQYRHLGKAGIKVSELSIGSWVTYGKQVDVRAAREILQVAWEAGVNFFDNAEAYAGGQSEIIMGQALRELGLPREQYLISTKIFWGGKGPNDVGLNYKHIIEGVNNALKRLGLDYVDFVFAHRPDPETPIEETVWAFNQVIQQGKAFYWGTSEWSAAEILLAYQVARENKLRPPSMEQPQYNLLHRKRFEQEYAVLYKELGYGTTIWSPLASGLLTGKYNQGTIPEGSRAQLEGYGWLKDRLLDPVKLEVTRRLAKVAEELGVSLAQMSLAWVLKNPNVSTVITGASRVEQVKENMKAADVVPLLTDDVMAKIEGALEGYRED
ncbi:MAG: aldo/keto reductase [Chloroflexi bacterium]|mgnify:CR=1 FL=1|jgi:voltage-dependent potassium channel beta subunit|nr:aldo/keto reductase [Anaerolineaceae bacterium]NLI44104.1 aldo/keto reductase [Chloroflexota bacterium]HOE35155.1 aldo/keto reductase [Anaerolineaceae bacterium]HOT26293.1 aldo/keto reductase [Anaerolineaceae bacterium]HQH58395.1 aldo/keto reductase [Anaerolineaceae bacterium]